MEKDAVWWVRLHSRVGVKLITIDLTIVVSKDIFIDRSIDVYDVDL